MNIKQNSEKYCQVPNLPQVELMRAEAPSLKLNKKQNIVILSITKIRVIRRLSFDLRLAIATLNSCLLRAETKYENKFYLYLA